MELAKVYSCKHPKYSYMVQFKRRGFKSYRRYFGTKKEADQDCTAYNDRLLREGREGYHIGPRERRQLEALIDALREQNMTIFDATELIRNLPRERSRIESRIALADFLAARDKAGRAYATIKNLKNRINPFLDHCGKQYIQEITESDCREYLFRPVSPQSQMNDRRALSAFFNYLSKRGVGDVPPIDRIELPTIKRDKAVVILRPAHARIWFRRLEEHCPELVAYYAIALFAGLRPSEILHLEKSDLTPSGIRVTGGKMRGRKRRIVPRSPVLDRWLSAYPPSFDWPEVDTRPHKKARGLCPITWVSDLPRHTYISVQLALCNDENQVARWAGNSPDVIYTSYFETMRREKSVLLGMTLPIFRKQSPL